MLFHIQSTHSYKTCGAKDPEKKKIMRSAFLSAGEKGIKIQSPFPFTSEGSISFGIF